MSHKGVAQYAMTKTIEVSDDVAEALDDAKSEIYGDLAERVDDENIVSDLLYLHFDADSDIDVDPTSQSQSNEEQQAIAD